MVTATNNLTLIVPYYRNCAMLKRQVEEWIRYPPGLKVICVDDGSPEPAFPIINQVLGQNAPCVELYPIAIDIPWNRGGARNLGAHVAKSEWIIQVDIDHLLPAACRRRTARLQADPAHWYRFPRWRVGAADETRKKDQIPPTSEYGTQD